MRALLDLLRAHREGLVLFAVAVAAITAAMMATTRDGWPPWAMAVSSFLALVVAAAALLLLVGLVPWPGWLPRW